jgi:hypothetical protein
MRLPTQAMTAATGRKMHFTGTTLLRLKDGKISTARDSYFILPTRVDAEESRILRRAEGVDGEAFLFLPGWRQDFFDGGGDFPNV